MQKEEKKSKPSIPVKARPIKVSYKYEVIKSNLINILESGPINHTDLMETGHNRTYANFDGVSSMVWRNGKVVNSKQRGVMRNDPG